MLQNVHDLPLVHVLVNHLLIHRVSHVPQRLALLLVELVAGLAILLVELQQLLLNEFLPLEFLLLDLLVPHNLLAHQQSLGVLVE